MGHQLNQTEQMAFCDGCIDQMLTFPTINATLRLSIPYEYRIYGSLYFIMILTLTLIHELIFTLSGGDLLYSTQSNLQMSYSQTQNKSSLHQSNMPPSVRQKLKIYTRTSLKSQPPNEVDDIQDQIPESSRSEVHKKYNKYKHFFVKKSSQRPLKSHELPIDMAESKNQGKKKNFNESSQKQKKKQSSRNQSKKSSISGESQQEMKRKIFQLQQKLKQSEEKIMQKDQTIHNLKHQIDRFLKENQKKEQMKEQAMNVLQTSFDLMINGNLQQGVQKLVQLPQNLPQQAQEKIHDQFEQIEKIFKKSQDNQISQIILQQKQQQFSFVRNREEDEGLFRELNVQQRISSIVSRKKNRRNIIQMTWKQWFLFIVATIISYVIFDSFFTLTSINLLRITPSFFAECVLLLLSMI